MTWKRTKLKFLAAEPIRNGLGEPAEFDDLAWPRYIRTTDIGGPRVLRTDTFASLPPATAAPALVERGDILMSAAGTIGRTYLHMSDEPACFAGYLVRFRPIEGVEPRFISYWTQSTPFLDQVSIGAVRSTIDNFSAGKYQNLELTIPAPRQQRAIADYLDTETARIDDLVGRRGRLLELQQERRAALVATLLSTDGDAAAMWLGCIPTAWPLISLGLLAEVFNGTTPEGIDQDLGDVAWVTSGDIDQGVVSHPSGYISQQTRRAHGMRVAPPGSVVVGLIGQGRTRGLSAELGIAAALNQNISAIVPRDGRLDSKYLRLLLLLAYEDLRNGGRGANQAALNCEILKAYQVPLAPPDMQLKLVRTVADAYAKEEAVAEALRRQLNLLNERRQALVTAAVTGQIEIPGVAA